MGTVSYLASNTAALDAAAKGQFPTDPFSLTVDDGHGGTTTSQINFVIAPIPVATPDTATVVEGQSLTVTGPGVLANDTGDGLVVLQPPSAPIGTVIPRVGAFGLLTLNGDGSYSYTPNNTAALHAAPAGQRPQDVFTYTERDAAGDVFTSTLTITIDRLPVGNDDDAFIQAGGTAGGNVLTNDFDPDGDFLVSRGRRGAAGVPGRGSYGTIIVQADGTYSYVQDNSQALAAAVAGTHLHDVFEYHISSGDSAGASVGLLDIEINRAPVGNTTTLNTVEGSRIIRASGALILAFGLMRTR